MVRGTTHHKFFIFLILYVQLFNAIFSHSILKVYRFQEEYKLCLEGFQKALVYDPAWEDAIKLQKQLLNYLQNISDLIQNKVRYSNYVIIALSHNSSF